MEDGRLFCLLALQKLSFQRVAYCGAPRGGADLVTVFRTIMCMDDQGQQRNTPSSCDSTRRTKTTVTVSKLFHQRGNIATIHPLRILTYRKTVICSGFNLSKEISKCVRASVPNAHPSHRALVFSCAHLETRGLESYSPCSSFQPQPAVALELILNLSPSALRCQCSPKATATSLNCNARVATRPNRSDCGGNSGGDADAEAKVLEPKAAISTRRGIIDE